VSHGDDLVDCHHCGFAEGPTDTMAIKRRLRWFSDSRLLEYFGPILWSKRLRFRFERGLCCFIEFGRRRGACRDGNANFQKELFLAGWRANAHQAHRLCGRVSKLVRSIRWNIYGFARSHQHLCAAEGCLEFPFEDSEHLLEIVSVRRRAASGRNVHIDGCFRALRMVCRRRMTARRDFASADPCCLNVDSATQLAGRRTSPFGELYPVPPCVHWLTRPDELSIHTDAGTALYPDQIVRCKKTLCKRTTIVVD
jgi:hypothetical protein